jgi:hypothetical protein
VSPVKDELLAAALAYGKRGWPVFPCIERDKRPVFRGGFHIATTNPATIDRWWRARPYNIGLATGPVSGLWVVDVDEGGELDGLPPTLEAETARGRHLYFAWPGGDLRNTAGAIGPHIDTRGAGGYVLAPPSTHPSGKTYRWAVTGEPIAAPAWLLERARTRRTSDRAIAAAGVRSHYIGNVASTNGAYGRAALNAEVGALMLTPKGGRNHALNKAAFSLFQLVAGGELAEGEVLAALWQACAANGLIGDDGKPAWERTVASARTAGLAHPRRAAA